MKHTIGNYISALLLLGLSQTYISAATVDTDQMDYQPDTTATIMGSGFEPGETVQLQVLNLTTPSDVGAEHDPWTTNADVNGDFLTTWYVTADETNQTLQLTATGLTSGLVAQRVFTDSATVTHATVSISADTAADSASPAWTTLGKIVVSENNKADFSIGTGVTLILKTPAGWQFNTAATLTTTFSGPEISAASTVVSDASTLTVTVTVTNNNKYQDIFTISGVQIMPTTGNTLSTGLQIYRPTTGGGTFIIKGVTTSTDGSSGTSFGDLTETHGVFAGYTISGTNSMTAGVSKNLTIQKTDQYGNAVNDGTTKTLTFSGLGSVGANNPKINGATTAFSSGISVAFNSSGLATTTLALIPYKAETVTLNVTDGTKTSAAVSGGLALTVSATTASKLAFTTSAVTVAVGVASSSITVQRQDQFGNPVTAEGTRTVTLSSSSTGTVTFIPASLSIASGLSSASFTYTDTKPDAPTITAASTSPGTITPATQSETVTKATPALYGATASQGITYGTANVSLSGTVSAAGSVYPTNGETVSVTINGISTNAIVAGGAGGFSVNFSTASLPYSAGAYTITYAYAGDASLNASANNTDTTLTVNKAALVITANNDTKTYGQAKTYGTGLTSFTTSGLKNGETIGTMTITASGGTATNAPVGTYNLTPSAAAGGTFNPANYTITYNSGTLTVNKAGISVTVTSSINPSGFNDSVSFTATLPADATGNVAFLTNSSAFSVNSLTGGIASSSATTLLPRGTNAITAQYAGDGNYSGSTNTIYQVVTNHPPVATTMNVLRTAGLAVRLRWSDIATNWNDADGDAVSNIGINLTTTNGYTLATNSAIIIYAAENANINDEFSYTVSDGFGGTATGYVEIVVTPFTSGQAITGQQSTNLIGGATFTVVYYGIPTYTYELQRSTNLSLGNGGWVNIFTNTVGPGGSVTNVDSFIDLAGYKPLEAYYRVGWHP